MTLTADTSQVKAQFSEFIGRVTFGHERVLVLRRGKPVAALVSVEDLRDWKSPTRLRPQPISPLSTPL